MYLFVHCTTIPYHHHHPIQPQPTTHPTPPHTPHHQINLAAVTNILDKWLVASTRHLVNFVHEEMNAYRLYTVVPRLVHFIEHLTNIYVRYNRKRLKGSAGQAEGDCENALATLYHTLVVLCKVMAPFTPFFTESMYQNLRRIDPESEASVHFTTIPPVEQRKEGDQHIEDSVERMQRVIELGRTIRERHNKPTRLPLKQVVVVHPDTSFLADVAGVLRVYVCEELNVRELETCADPVKYAELKAVPNLPVLGKKLGKVCDDDGFLCGGEYYKKVCVCVCMYVCVCGGESMLGREGGKEKK